MTSSKAIVSGEVLVQIFRGQGKNFKIIMDESKSNDLTAAGLRLVENGLIRGVASAKGHITSTGCTNQFHVTNYSQDRVGSVVTFKSHQDGSGNWFQAINFVASGATLSFALITGTPGSPSGNEDCATFTSAALTSNLQAGDRIRSVWTVTVGTNSGLTAIGTNAGAAGLLGDHSAIPTIGGSVKSSGADLIPSLPGSFAITTNEAAFTFPAGNLASEQWQMDRTYGYLSNSSGVMASDAWNVTTVPDDSRVSCKYTITAGGA